MKTRANWLLIPAVALGLGACNKKEEVKPPDAPAAVAEPSAKEGPAAPPTVDAKAPQLGVEERAAKLGFARHLPQDTEAVLAFYNGTKTAERIKNSKLWHLVEQQMGGAMMGQEGEMEMEEQDMEVPEAEQETPVNPDNSPLADPAGPDEEPVGPAALFGTEFTLAMGKSTGEQGGNLLTVYRRMGYFHMRSVARAFVAAVKSGDVSELEDAFTSGYGSELAKDLLNDPQSGMAAVEKAKMPPIYLAFRTTEAGRDAAAQQVASTLAAMSMMGEMVEPVTIETAGLKFEGSKILGSKVSAQMAADREEMDEELGAATVDQLLAAVAKKEIVVASGLVGDYVLLFIGGSVDDLKLASDVGQSLVGSDSLAFSDAYASKELAALIYGQKEATETLIKAAGGLSELTNGLRDGLAGAEGLGDTRDLDALFQIVADRETALRKLASTESSGMVAFFEEGLKIESFGGTDNGMLDWKSPNTLGHLGDSEDVVMFANMTGDAAYDEKARAYVEALLETGYAMTMKIAEAPIEGGEIAQFKEMAKLFDTKFRPDMIALWDAFSNDFGDSLGKECAMVVDLKGGAPAVPGVPQVVLDKGKVPRVSFVSPVTDRAKISGSWDKMNTTLTGTLAKISELAGSEIPMQKPMSSESNGNTTWFFPMPFLTDDFVPSVTVSDKWFAASTSKKQALDLIAKADAGGEPTHGVVFSMNFKALEKYSNETLQLVDENAEAIMGSPMPAEQKEMIEKAISVLGDLDKLTVHTRREGAVLRSSVHIKTR